MSAPRVSSKTPGTGVARRSSARAPGTWAATSARASAGESDLSCAGGDTAAAGGETAAVAGGACATLTFIIAALASASATTKLLANMMTLGRLGLDRYGRGRFELEPVCRRAPSLACASGTAAGTQRSATRMVLGVQLLQPLACYVGVDLGGGQIAVTEQHLHHAQVGAVVEQMGGKGVPQSVRREFLADAGLARVTLDDVPEGLARHAIATPGREQVVGLALEQDLAARAAREFLERAHRLLAERNQPLAIALAEDPDDALVEVDL